MPFLTQVLRRPLISEKSTQMKQHNRYVVEVDPRASKGDIRAAIQARFKVNVLSVHTVKVRGKFRRKSGPVGGYQTDRKKAIVRVKAGQQLVWEEAS